MPVKLQTYSLELKAQAVRMAVEDGLGITETAKRLSIYDSTLSCLVAKISKTPNAPTPGGQIVQTAEVKRLEKENSRLRKDVCTKDYDNAPMRGFWSLFKNELNIEKPYNSRKKQLKALPNTECSSITDNESSLAWGTDHLLYTQEDLNSMK